MRLRLLPVLGLLLLPLRAGAANVYELFQAQVAEEQTTGAFDEPVIEFIRAVYEPKWEMTEEEVQAAVRGEFWSACGSTAPQNDVTECGRAMENIGLLAREEQRLRAFGRSIQRIGAAQELPLSEIPGRSLSLTTDLSGIINIWRAGTGSIRETATGAVLLRTKSITEEDPTFESLKTAVTDLAEALETMTENEKAAVLWRYQYGARLTEDLRGPRFPAPVPDTQSGPGTERQFVFKAWPEVRDPLLSVFDALPPADTFDPPLSQNEAAYMLFPEELTEMLPEGVILWARAGAFGDAGIVWEFPIEPLLPSLMSDEAENAEPILGGRYPPEPEEGRGLCSMPLASRGHLCRPLTPTNGERCPVEEDNPEDADAIVLTSCEADEKPALTVAGSDVCREIEWKDPDPNFVSCKLQITCRDDCGPAGIAATSKPKKPDGTLEICVVNNPPVEAATYVLLHELAHSRQLCDMPAKEDINEGLTGEEALALCCRMEGEAWRSQCMEMQKDGFFEGKVVDGIPIDAQVCGEFLTFRQCFGPPGDDGQPTRCPVSRTYPPTFEANFVPLLQPIVNGVPDLCDDAMDPEKMDPRVEAAIRTVNRRDPVCVPGAESTYKNTIGNNLCYIGQCIEESLELHRVTPGRQPATAGDEAFPFDSPLSGTPLATILRSIPDSSPPLPAYRPQMLVHRLENALCQLQGLPDSTPPHLCAFSPSRRLSLPLQDAASTAQVLFLQAREDDDAASLVEDLASALGSRIGADLQGRYLRLGTAALSETIGLAVQLLQETLSVRFPINMCPSSLDG